MDICVSPYPCARAAPIFICRMCRPFPHMRIRMRRYERGALDAALGRRGVDPIAGSPLARGQAAPNLGLRHAIEAWLELCARRRRRAELTRA